MPMPTYDKATIDKLMAIRKRLRMEFGEAPALHDPELLDLLIEYSGKSRDGVTRAAIVEVMSRVGEPWESRHSLVFLKTRQNV